MNEISMKHVIRKADVTDVPAMVDLSYEKRKDYEKAQHQFWRHAAGAEETQAKWFNELLTQEDYILLVAESESKIAGFIIGKIMKAPEVYDPGGFTLMVDDFCVLHPTLWKSMGSKLLEELKRMAKSKGATQTVAVCGAHDEPKRQFMKDEGLTTASEWYVGEIG